MRALTKTLDLLDQFESSAAYSVAIMSFELGALSAPSTGDTSCRLGQMLNTDDAHASDEDIWER